MSVITADMGRLSKLLGDELSIYRQIHKQTEKQMELLAEDDIDAFNISLHKRESLIEQIKGLHQESERLMQSYISNVAGGNKADAGIDSLKKQIHETIQACAEINDRNIAIVRDMTQKHSKKIEEKSAQRKGIGGYAQAVANLPELFDKKT